MPGARATLEPVSLPEPIQRLVDALNSHDPSRVAAAFAEDYRAELPMHPERNFVGNAQVEQNYGRIFADIPDLRAAVLRWTADGDVIWSEWEMTGTRQDGSNALLRGVVIAHAPRGGPIAHTRFYIDPVANP